MSESILTLPQFNLPAWEAKVGDVVVNFNTVARIDAIDPERGWLLREVARPRAGRWHADPAKCRPVL